MLSVDPHPLLRLGAFRAVLPAPLGRLESPEWLRDLLSLEAPAPIERAEGVRAAVRDLLRHGGYRPAGRGKPASEYLARAAGEGRLRSINLVVDACNAVSLHSGLPISVVDLDRTTPPLRVGIAAADESYVFNTGGQEIRVEGLLCLHDAAGPCANAVKDAERTKTCDATERVLGLVWGREDLAERTERATAWYRTLLERAGATCRDAVAGPQGHP